MPKRQSALFAEAAPEVAGEVTTEEAPAPVPTLEETLRQWFANREPWDQEMYAQGWLPVVKASRGVPEGVPDLQCALTAAVLTERSARRREGRQV